MMHSIDHLSENVIISGMKNWNTSVAFTPTVASKSEVKLPSVLKGQTRVTKERQGVARLVLPRAVCTEDVIKCERVGSHFMTNSNGV